MRSELLINNEWITTGRTFEDRNPYDGSLLAEMQEAGPSEADAAAYAARNAFERGPWGTLTGDDRAKILRRIAHCLSQRREEFERLETLDTGKPIVESREVDIEMSIKAFDFFADQAENIRGETMEVGRQEFLNMTVYEPVGVVLVISPWNFPLHLVTRSLCPALAAGNTAIVKVSELTPLTTTLLGEILIEAGLPPGVVNIVNGGPALGKQLVNHAEVDMIAFTGSVPTGIEIQKAAANRMKRTLPELGGKSPSVILNDADIEQAVNGMIFGYCFNQGEVCSGGTRIYVQSEIYDEFTQRFVAASRELRLGNGLDERTQMGPLISHAHLEKVQGFVDRAVQAGARVLLGGKRARGPGLEQGPFFEPTIVEIDDNHLEIAQEEVFGPVVIIKRFDAVDEGLALANDTKYGLAASFWSRNIKRALRGAKRLRAGSVWVNTYNQVFMQGTFGGYKMSGIGRDYGHVGVREFMELKNILVDLNDRSVDWYHDKFA